MSGSFGERLRSSGAFRCNTDKSTVGASCLLASCHPGASARTCVGGGRGLGARAGGGGGHACNHSTEALLCLPFTGSAAGCHARSWRNRLAVEAAAAFNEVTVLSIVTRRTWRGTIRPRRATLSHTQAPIDQRAAPRYDAAKQRTGGGEDEDSAAAAPGAPLRKGKWTTEEEQYAERDSAVRRWHALRRRRRRRARR
jgi:hypothetical protein